MATWRWNAFLRSQCPASKRCVYINMDETCIRMCPETGKGLVFVESGKKKKHVMEQDGTHGYSSSGVDTCFGALDFPRKARGPL